MNLLLDDQVVESGVSFYNSVKYQQQKMDSLRLATANEWTDVDIKHQGPLTSKKGDKEKLKKKKKKKIPGSVAWSISQTPKQIVAYSYISTLE